MAARFQLRAASSADVRAISALEQEVFSDPWSEAGIREAIAGPWTFVLVAEVEHAIAAYAVGREVAGSAELLNLAVAPAHRRAGIGRALLAAVLARFRRHRVDMVHLEVRASNEAALALYRAEGFVPAGRRARYYRFPEEDAIVLRLTFDAGALEG